MKRDPRYIPVFYFHWLTHCPGEHADGLGQHVSAAQAAADDLRKNPLKMPPKNELPGIRVQKN